jgi:precorrin-2 methylase
MDFFHVIGKYFADSWDMLIGRSGGPLALRNETLTVLPGPLPEAELKARLVAAEATAIVKVGRHFAKVRRVIARQLEGAPHETLLTLGINLGVIAFAVGTAIACLRATERARKAEAEAQIEAERYRLSEGTLDTLLAAEPQALLTVADRLDAVLNLLDRTAR